MIAHVKETRLISHSTTVVPRALRQITAMQREGTIVPKFQIVPYSRTGNI